MHGKREFEEHTHNTTPFLQYFSATVTTTHTLHMEELHMYVQNYTVQVSVPCAPVLEGLLWGVPLPWPDWGLVVDVGLEMGTSAEDEAVAVMLHIGVCAVGPLPLAMWTRPLSNRLYRTLFTLALSRDPPNLRHTSRADSGCWGLPLKICKMESSKEVLAAAKVQITHTHSQHGHTHTHDDVIEAQCYGADKGGD